MYSARFGVPFYRIVRPRPAGLGGPVLQTIVAAACLSLAASFPAVAQEILRESDRTSAEGVVEELYELVTFQAGTTPDWDVVRSLFLPEAVVVLRTSRTETLPRYFNLHPPPGTSRPPQASPRTHTISPGVNGFGQAVDGLSPGRFR